MTDVAASPSLLLSCTRRHPHAGVAVSLLLHLVALVYVSPHIARQTLPEPGMRMTVRMSPAASEAAVAAPDFDFHTPGVAPPVRLRETHRSVLARHDSAVPPVRPAVKQDEPAVSQLQSVARSGGVAAGESATPLPGATAMAPPAQASAVSAPAPVSVSPGFDAAYLDNPAPAYPALSRRIGEQGKVLLRVYVEADGHPSRVELRTSSGYQRLDQSALDAVRHWRFTPARQSEQPIADWVVVPIVFNLRSA